MSGRLEGHTALVTGASQGLGKVIATTYAREGARVVLAARSRERLEETAAAIEAEGGTAVVVPADVGRPDDVDALALRIAADVGPLDTIVSNSGITGPTAELWNITPHEWEETVRVNLTGTFLLCRALLPPMIERRRGSIVVIGSTAAKRPLYGRTPYAATKAGLVGLVRTLAIELGPVGVRANLISPGAVAGPRIDDVIREQARAAGVSYEAFLEEAMNATPLRRMVPPEDVAAAAVFLASDDAASITGEDLNVSAGLAMH
jgi:NAD(P)-dependent dehydrogenase (short-subunit alcohol dehydrogenase family)